MMKKCEITGKFNIDNVKIDFNDDKYLSYDVFRILAVELKNAFFNIKQAKKMWNILKDYNLNLKRFIKISGQIDKNNNKVQEIRNIGYYINELKELSLKKYNKNTECCNHSELNYLISIIFNKYKSNNINYNSSIGNYNINTIKRIHKQITNNNIELYNIM